MSTHIVGVNPKEYNGKLYKSTLEAKTAETLDKLEIPWEYETKTYTIQDGFYCPWQKDKVRVINYIPDFVIGPVMVETKGFETPDWKIKKKVFFKWLLENEPDAIWYMVKSPTQLLMVLDRHWSYLGYMIETTSKPSKKNPSERGRFDSIAQAMELLNLKGKALGPILKALTGEKEFVYGYKWKLIKLSI